MQGPQMHPNIRSILLLAIITVTGAALPDSTYAADDVPGGNLVLGQWTDGRHTHLTFEQNGRYKIEFRSCKDDAAHGDSGDSDCRDGKTKLGEGAYEFGKLFCWNFSERRAKGNLKIYEGANHCCYLAKSIANYLILSALDGPNCPNYTLKPAKKNR